jgi:hypothetical protein
MRSNLILSVAAVALALGTQSFGIGGALAATPTTNFLASSTGHITNLLPAQPPSSAPGLSHITDSKHSASSNRFTLAGTHANHDAHIANLRAMHLAMRFVPSDRVVSTSRDGLKALSQTAHQSSGGLAGLRNAAGLAQAQAPTSPLARKFALAAAGAQSNDPVKLLSNH